MKKWQDLDWNIQRRWKVLGFWFCVIVIVFFIVNLVIWFHAGVVRGTVISRSNGNIEILITQGGKMHPTSSPYYDSYLDPGKVVLLARGHYFPWEGWKMKLGDEIQLRCLPQKLPQFDGVLPITVVQSVKRLTSFEKQGKLFLLEDTWTCRADSADFETLITIFNKEPSNPQYMWQAMGKLQEGKDSPYYHLIYTGRNIPKNGRPFMTLFTVTTAFNRTTATAEQYEYAEVEYKPGNHADMVFSHDGNTEALRVPLR